MKRTWYYVFIEMYKSGTVKAAVLKSKVADQQPPELYRQEPGRELFGEWIASLTEAHEIVAEARALNASLINTALTYTEQGVAA